MEHPSTDEPIFGGCLLRILLFLLVVVAFMLLGLGVVIGIVIAGA